MKLYYDEKEQTIGDEYSVLYETSGLEHLTVEQRHRLAEVHNEYPGITYLEAEALIGYQEMDDGRND